MTAREMITGDDIDAELCLLGGAQHDYRKHRYEAYPGHWRESWRCIWCHAVACGDVGEHDPCWRHYHHKGGHRSRAGVTWPLGGNRPDTGLP